MPINELDLSYFNREQIKSRMLRKASELWGYHESEMDDFDPLINLLMEVCSFEFEKIAGEIGNVQNRILERLAELLYPGTTTIKPSYGIIQVVSSEPYSFLKTDSQFLYKPHENDPNREGFKGDLYFSPVTNIKIWDGAIKFMASSHGIFEIREGVQKTAIGYSNKKSIEHQHTLWLGLDLNSEIENLEGLSFFFNWINQAESREWYPFLASTKWFLNENSLSIQPGFPAKPGLDTVQNQMISEYDPIVILEKEILELYSSHYIMLKEGENKINLKEAKKLYPLSFSQLFDDNVLKLLKSQLIWIEIRFPTIVPLKALESVYTGINTVPVLNRQLNRFSYKLSQVLNIIPLETSGTFLSMKEITNSENQTIKLLPFSNPANLTSETYTLRYGIDRFNQRNIFETTLNLVELIKEERSRFSAIGADFLSQNLNELNQIISRIDERLKTQKSPSSPYPYLVVKPEKPGENILVEFWSSQGEIANRIPIGSRLTPYRNSNVKTNSNFFMTTTLGGQNKFTDYDKIRDYKQLLLTHDRIVTFQDLKLFVQADLGRAVKDIGYKKSFIIGGSETSGFMQCMMIEITPEPGYLNLEEWENRIEILRIKIEKKSSQNVPIQIKLKGDI